MRCGWIDRAAGVTLINRKLSTTMPQFEIDGQKFSASNCITEIVANLDRYYAEPTDEHADKGREHWTDARPEWMAAAWPGGTRYETRCLDGGAWDRSTSWGMFATLDEALMRAKQGVSPGLKRLRQLRMGDGER